MGGPGPASGAGAGGGHGDAWYFTRDQLAASASRRCGLDADKELSYRQQAANLIQDMGQRLQVSQLCINTAIVYMHRFYAFHSFTHFHRNAIAAAALFLAAKVEEQPRKLEYVIKVAHVCLHRGESAANLDPRSEQYQDQAQDLVFNENVLLQTLGFDVAIDHPHTHVVRTCHLVKAPKDLAQTSYFMASNSLHLTTMCLQYRPTVVACFCIHLASKWSNWQIPQSNEGKPWFSYVDRSVTTDLLEKLTAEFLHIFDKCPSRLKRKMMSISSSGNSPHSGMPQAGPSQQAVGADKKPYGSEDLEKSFDKEYEREKRRPVAPGGYVAAAPPAPVQPTPQKIHFREYREKREREERERRQQAMQQQQPRPSAPPTQQPPARAPGTAPAPHTHHKPHPNHHKPHPWPHHKPPHHKQDQRHHRQSAPQQSTQPQPNPSQSQSQSQPQVPQQQPAPTPEPRSEPPLRAEPPPRAEHPPRVEPQHRAEPPPRTEPPPRAELTPRTEPPPRAEPPPRPEPPPRTEPPSRAESQPRAEPPPRAEPMQRTRPPSLFSPENATAPATAAARRPAPPQRKPQVHQGALLPTPTERVPPPVQQPQPQPPIQQPPRKRPVDTATVVREMQPPAVVSPLTSPTTPSPLSQRSRPRTSSSSEPELVPVVKKLDDTPGYENVIRDSQRGNAIRARIDRPTEATHRRQPSPVRPVNGIETDPAMVSNLLKESLARPVTITPPAERQIRPPPSARIPPPAPVEPAKPPQSVQPAPVAQISVATTVAAPPAEGEHRHRSDKKKKKEKHKHKDRDKPREERKKHKKDKDREKKRDSAEQPTVEAPSADDLNSSSASGALRITIPRDKLATSPGLKIKIPKERLAVPPPTPPSAPRPPPPVVQQQQWQPPSAGASGIKIKIPKEVLETSRKRAAMDPNATAGPPPKMYRHNGMPHKVEGAEGGGGHAHANGHAPK